VKDCGTHANRLLHTLENSNWSLKQDEAVVAQVIVQARTGIHFLFRSELLETVFSDLFLSISGNNNGKT
jgi:hypothetical protein